MHGSINSLQELFKAIHFSDFLFPGGVTVAVDLATHTPPKVAPLTSRGCSSERSRWDNA